MLICVIVNSVTLKGKMFNMSPYIQIKSPHLGFFDFVSDHDNNPGILLVHHVPIVVNCCFQTTLRSDKQATTLIILS